MGIIAVAAMVLGLVALGSGAGTGPLGSVDPNGLGLRLPRVSMSVRPLDQVSPAAAQATEHTELPGWIGVALVTLAAALILLGIGVLIWRTVEAVAIRRRQQAIARAAGAEIVEIPVDEVAQALAMSATDLRSGMAVDDAIIECWRRLEELGDRVGLARQRTDTSTEYGERLLAGTPVDERDLGELAALYRTAMFSSHTSGDAARECAIACLDRLSESMRAAAAVGDADGPA